MLGHDDNAYKLPRGRKDWGEPLAATAARETFEETGYHTSLLLLTRTSQPALALSDPSHPYHAEAKAAQCTAEDGTLAVVPWYVGVGDSTAKPVAGTQMEDENYEAVWVAYDEAPSLMADSVYDLELRRLVQTANGI
ncbi:hypothetical protein B0T14DRAFT_570956 [Immersiella caudata]|uniref:Nudix hydrolase domain-containing protein n=1 Tax=Immersiella caudata TaxID=314043 RepID=A0AA39TS97_9PEZI|nr:hypothetical protein B0T14DRAFT_570956 [Immersiella caudata]